MIVQADQVANKSFDYVIIGGGLAGLVVAARLTEDPDTSVLVVEAGDSFLDEPVIDSPLFMKTHLGNDKYDWNYLTTSQEGLGERQLSLNRGKVLGGSSAINFFQFHRPAKSDIDAFEELGNKGWNWDLLVSYYDKAENFAPPTVKEQAMSYDIKCHGQNGPVVVGYPRQLSGLESTYHEALASLDIPRANEPFSGDTKGTWLTPVTIDPSTGKRTYSASAYYSPNANRTNFSILTAALASKIDTIPGSDSNGHKFVATSVSFVHNGKVYSINVRKEAILAAGAFGSPQLLELSGIGHKNVLANAGVPLKQHLPGVGNNLQEHLQVISSFEMNGDPENKYLTYDCLRDSAQKDKQVALFKSSGKGILATSTICMTFVPLSSVSPSYKELQNELTGSLRSSASNGKYAASVQKQHMVQLEHIKKQNPSCEQVLVQGAIEFPTHAAKPGTKYVTLVSLLNHPFSRGNTHITSADAKSHPEINPRYFDEKYDLKSLVETMKFGRRVVQQEPMKSILTGFELAPGAEYDTDEKLEGYIKKFVRSTWHTVGSCAMLPREDDGVVDNQLRVYGTSNIRVVDLSIVPLHIGAHTQATAYAIAELAADIIKGKVAL